jgi:hypothetical protein
VDTPTPAMIRLWMPATVDFDALGYGDDDELQKRIDEVIAQLRRFTCRQLPDIVVEDEPLYRRALWMLTYLSMAETSIDRLDTLADFDLLKSFGAGNYNEVRRDFAEMFKARMLVPWGALNTLLWDLMTDECRARWDEHFAAGVVPAFEIGNEGWLMTGEYDDDRSDPWV